VLVLSWRVFRPGAETRLLEEAVTVRQTKPTTQPGVQAHSARPAQAEPEQARRPDLESYQTVAFERGRLRIDPKLGAGRVTILGERTWRDEQEQLRVEFRLLSRLTDTRIDVQAYYVDSAGRRHRAGKSAIHVLPASKPTVVRATVPKAALAYELVLVDCGSR
jgi:hypothetical protein